MTLVDSSQILFPGTSDRVLNGVYGANDTDLPADTVVWGGTWPAGMGDLGYTKGGIKLTMGRTIQDEYFDQDVDPVMQYTTQRDIRVMCTLGQTDDPDKILVALGYGTKTTLDPVSGTRGHIDIDIPGGLPPIVNCVPAFEILQQSGEAMRVILYRATVIAPAVMEFKKDAVVTVPYEARAMRDSSGSNNRVMKLRKITPALA